MLKSRVTLFIKIKVQMNPPGATPNWSGRLGHHTVIIGTDISHSSEDALREFGPFFQTIGVPAEVKGNPDIDKWAVFANDTITLGRLSITPGHQV